MTSRHVFSAFYSIAGLLTLIAIWQVSAQSGLVSRAFLASPLATITALWDGFNNGDIAVQMLATISLMLKGWLVASIVAVALGSLIGMSDTARQYLQPTLEFLRPLPASAIIPLAVATFGLGNNMALGVIVFGSLWPILLSTVQGFSFVDPTLREVARTVHLPASAFAWKIGLPNALPDILAGMRLSANVALILAVVCEMLTGQVGLGTGILQAARSFQAPDLYAGMVLLGLIGFAFNYIIVIAERYLLRWKLGR